MHSDDRFLDPIDPITDYRLNDGSTSVFDPTLVPAADLEAIGGELIISDDACPAPFDKLRYGFCPQIGGMRFSVHTGRNMIVTCALANEEQAGRQVWDRLVKTCCHFRDGWPEVLNDPGNDDVDFDDPAIPHFYLKHGCPDLIRSGMEIACPMKPPYLATLIAPPRHRGADQNMIELAFRLRNAVAVLIMQSEWFEDERIRIAKLAHETVCRSGSPSRIVSAPLMRPMNSKSLSNRWDYAP